EPSSAPVGTGDRSMPGATRATPPRASMGPASSAASSFALVTTITRRASDKVMVLSLLSGSPRLRRRSGTAPPRRRPLPASALLPAPTEDRFHPGGSPPRGAERRPLAAPRTRPAGARILPPVRRRAPARPGRPDGSGGGRSAPPSRGFRRRPLGPARPGPPGRVRAPSPRGEVASTWAG